MENSLLFERTHLEQAAQPVLGMPCPYHLTVLELVNVDGHDLDWPPMGRKSGKGFYDYSE